MELPPENVQAAEDAVVEVLTSLVETPLTADDLARGKALLKSYMVFASETAEQQAAYDGYWFVVAEEGYGDTYLDRIEAVTVEDLRAAAADVPAARDPCRGRARAGVGQVIADRPTV